MIMLLVFAPYSQRWQLLRAVRNLQVMGFGSIIAFCVGLHRRKLISNMRHAIMSLPDPRSRFWAAKLGGISKLDRLENRLRTCQFDQIVRMTMSGIDRDSFSKIQQLESDPS
jgi:hypothetical protein